MTSTLRTKQQIACDGVRTTWYADAFTEILHQQVTTQFSMDGVIPSQNIAQMSVKEPSTRIEQEQYKLRTFAGNIDGVRLPWKPQAV
jgi:hypothetical protein